MISLYENRWQNAYGFAGERERWLLKRNNLPREDIIVTPPKIPWIAIFGNPNCGKTALFNRLTGLHHKVGNYPGVTVEKKSGWLKKQRIIVRDFPGTYSLNPKTMDERIVSEMVQSWRKPENRPKAAIVIVDATNLTRNLYLALQILDWQVPTIIALNMMDEARKQGIHIDVDTLRVRLNAHAVIPTSAKYGEGIEDIVDAIVSIPGDHQPEETQPRLLEIERFLEPIEPLKNYLEILYDRLNHHPLVEALRLLSEPGYINYLLPYCTVDEIETLRGLLEDVKNTFRNYDIPYQSLEQAARYAYIDVYLADTVHQEKVEQKHLSEKIDGLLTHRVAGPIIFIGILAFIFNAIFSWAQYPMEAISYGVDWLSVYAANRLPDGDLQSLIVDGVIAGVGSILVFFPQIILLVFFLAVLEDSGYMSRMAFMMDRFMRKIGLHGRSVLPLLSGFACAIPAIMSSRTIENWRDRIITILITPLMSCSARLPVYTLLIAAFIPDKQILGFFSLQGITLMGIYFLGMFTAIFVALIFKNIFKRRASNVLIMELPPYRMPLPQSIWWQIYDRGKAFLVNAGSIILAISIVLWFLASYPRAENHQQLSAKERLEFSFAGRLGHAIEPAIEPLGYDWKIGVGLITSFAAREVIVSTLATIYNLENEEAGKRSLIEAMQADRDSQGNPVFTTLVAVSLMVFFAYAAQCMATFAIIKRETNSWRWPVFMVIYMTVLAYLASLIVYQGGRLMGWS
ncbi:MAG: ferrous iron transport protein B [Caldithrix sp.]|nr:ferrous iron transport protein B [Caldithrix sp.]